MLRLAAERERLTVSPTSGAPDRCRAHRRRQRPCPGAGAAPAPPHRHLPPGCRGETSWHGYASHVIETARRLKPELALKVPGDRPSVPTSA